jgi:hypothetical protein
VAGSRRQQEREPNRETDTEFIDAEHPLMAKNPVLRPRATSSTHTLTQDESIATHTLRFVAGPATDKKPSLDDVATP